MSVSGWSNSSVRSRVRISKLDGNREKIPKKYNEETVIGQEICDDAAGIGHGLVYNLSAR